MNASELEMLVHPNQYFKRSYTLKKLCGGANREARD